MKSYRLPAEHRIHVQGELLPWFQRHARRMPWRDHRTPYRIWISETMLQQTRVDTVIPYFLKWMKVFPTVEALATAEQEQVLKVWEGLGYYARARNLHAGAQQVVNEFGGELPRVPRQLGSIKGIGPYTLAAIMSLAFDEPFAVLDGNVERVLTRLCAIGEDIRKPAVKVKLRALAGRLLADHPPGEFNEAVMELGATVCTPTSPQCGACPLRSICRAGKSGSTHRFPFKSSRPSIPTVTVGAGVVWKSPDNFLVARRNEKGMLGGLWEFPGGKQEGGESIPECIQRELEEELGIRVEVGKELVNVRHSYTHFHLRMSVHHCRWLGDPPQAIDCADFRWVTLQECEKLPFSKADLKVIEALKKGV
jgi:A/G-specific adenine glycosylase